MSRNPPYPYPNGGTPRGGHCQLYQACSSSKSPHLVGYPLDPLLATMQLTGWRSETLGFLGGILSDQTYTGTVIFVSQNHVRRSASFLCALHSYLTGEQDLQENQQFVDLQLGG